MEPEPHHPIIERPYEYAIADLRYHMGVDGSEPFLDLTPVHGETTRRLRFLSPQNLQIEAGFPSPTGGMVILDIRGRQLDGLGVEVVDWEASKGTITFFAREVVDVDGVSVNR
jgi:hypothetical protein